MKTKFMKVLGLVACLLGGSAFAAEGDIWEILPCDETGLIEVATPVSTFESPLPAGTNLYFKVRMIARYKQDGDKTYGQWHTKGKFSSDYDAALNPPRICLYVSGVKTYADLVGEYYHGDRNQFTDFIFKYTVKAGDFAMPMKLGTATGPADDADAGSQYYFDPKTSSAWSFVSDVEGVPVQANWWFWNGADPMERGESSPAATQDIALTKAGYYLKTVDFDNEWEEKGVLWRSVHEGSTQTIGVTPSLVAMPSVTESKTLYVWSTNEDAVVVKSDTIVHMRVGGTNLDPVYADYHVAAVTIVGDYAEFEIEGVAEDGLSGLVLCAYDHFTYSSSTGKREMDYVTVPVKCIEALPPSIEIKPENTTVVAGSNYTHYVTELSVRFTQAFSNDVTFTIKPRFESDEARTAGADWKDYIRVSDSKDISSISAATNFTFTIPAGKLIPYKGGAIEKIYLFALRSDKWTINANHLEFVAETDNEEAKAYISGFNETQGAININAMTPVILLPTEGDSSMTAVAGADRTLRIKVAGSYADMNSDAGYEVWIIKSSDIEQSFKQVGGETGRYKIGQGDYLYLTNTTAVLPAVQYSDTTHTPNKSIIYVKSPVSGLQSAERNFSVAVSAPAGLTITSDGKEKVSVMEGDAVGIEVKLDQPNTTGKSLFVFLAPVTEKDTNSVDCAFLAQKAGVGLEIGQYGTSVVGSFNMIDGCIGEAASTFRYKVILRDKMIFEEGDEVTSYLCKNTLTVVSKNVEPEVTYVEINQKKTMRIPTIGGSLSTKFPVNTDLKHEFGVKVNEPGTYDKTNKSKPFKVTWTFEEYNPTTGATVPYDGGMGDSITRYGNPDTLLVTNTFPYPLEEGNRVKITVALEDKDMRDHGDEENDEFYFYLDIVDKPTITVEPLYEAEPNRYLETEAGTASFNLNLEFNECKQPIVCQVKVASGDPGATNPGAFVLKPRTSSTLGNVVAKGGGIYEVTFPARRASVNIMLLSLDGTVTSASDGFVITPTMLTDDYEVPNSGGKTPKEYYLGVEQVVRVGNVAPTMDFLSPVPSTNAINVAIGQVEEPICWNFSDITNDFAKGITVSFKGGGGTNATYYSKAEANKAGETGFRPTFTSSGTYTVELVIKDADNGTATYEGSSMIWYYTVAASKNMKLIPHGPTAGLSAKYTKNYGAGRVFAKGNSGVSEFTHTINCLRDLSWRAYGYGYKVGDIDGQKLHYPYTHVDGEKTGYNLGRNTKIDSAGNASSKGGYQYSSFAGTDVYGKDADSFLYAWLVKDVESTSATTTWKVHTYKPEAPLAVDAGIEVDLPEGTITTEGGVTTAIYNDTTLEAIFSLEYLASDNMGDINFDGIPDAWFVGLKYFSDTETTSDTTVDDSTSMASYNKDADYLPELKANTIGYQLGILTNKPFTAILELRGYGEHLNDAPNNNGYTRLTGYKPDRCYLDPRDAVNGSTLTIAEYLAWRDYAAANGIADPDAPANWESWSPENPSDPMKEDTDEDGISDGFEYAFWYGAKVGFYDEATSNHTYLTGRRFDPRHPGQGTLITRETIMSAMNPTKPLAADLNTMDSDNDGLPDILEFQLGTNPFDFDSDGDGLPDGWEIVVSQTDPMKACTTPGTLDASRNGDNDAMAITSPLLEKNVAPTPFNIDQYTTFALVNANGDSAGVQWYATKDAATAEALETLTEESAEYYVIKTANGTYATTTQPFSTSENLLANDLYRENTYLLGEGDVVLMPIDVPAGTQLTEAAPTAKTACTVKKLSEAIDKKVLNAAWVYGRSGNYDAARGEVTTAGAAAGFLVLGRQLAASADAVVCALPSKERDVALLHYLVYQEFGFDPRTAWSSHSPLASRWTARTSDGQEVSGVYQVTQGGFANYSTRTRDYSTYDEFLVMSFFLNNGVLDDDDEAVVTAANPWTVVWNRYTTNPRGPSDQDAYAPPEELGIEAPASDDNEVPNGADSDNDGVPDGWELYIMAGPKKEGAYVFAPPYTGFTTAFGGTAPASYWSPFVAKASSSDTTSQIYLGGQANMDDLNELREFSGTDSCAAYTNCCSTILARTAQTAGAGDNRYTVDDSKWLNKFFPTDPWNVDTDGDGVKDSAEGGSFVYGSPVDNGLLWSIPGAGLNPCSVDTDLDGIPDGWEQQFAGSKVYEGEKAHYANGLPEKTGNPLEGLTDGMDGTVPDAYTTPNNATVIHSDGRIESGLVNRDYDRDGLENWQEYLTGTMRCWRYDDPITPWIAIPASAYYNADGEFDIEIAKAYFGVADNDTFWYNTLVKRDSGMFNPHFVTDSTPNDCYFSRVTNGWDIAFYDASLAGGVDKGPAGGAYYWFAKRIGPDKILDLWGGLNACVAENQSPSKYASCSPIDPDSDHDGMDDYYELFHGLNPLLGAANITDNAGKPYDIIASAYGDDGLGAWDRNYWQKDGKSALPYQPRGSEYDFVAYPWLNGIASADPDGDDIPNQSESIMPKVNIAGYHTDPSPLWMTDTSYTNSLVRRFFRVPTRFNAIKTGGESFVGDGVTYFFRDFDCFGYVSDGLSPAPALLPYQPEFWQLSSKNAMNWMFSFEENEGYDTDHNALSDKEEVDGAFGTSSDPIVADDPVRRQAMWFPGENAVLQTMPRVAENYPVAAEVYPEDPSFATFTVECWVKPDETMLTGEHVVLERAIWVDPSKAADEEYIRKNFQLAIKDGRWRAKFDSEGTYLMSEVVAACGTDATTGWTHLAATFDGTALILYVNGGKVKTQPSTAVPEHGVLSMAVNPGEGYTYWGNLLQSSGDAIIIGGSLKLQTEFDPTYKPTGVGEPVGKALDLTRGCGWNYYTRFFRGYIDEVRVWDGARSIDAIKGTMNQTLDKAAEIQNREDFYTQWSQGYYRYTKGVTGIVPELRYHFTFDSVPAADNMSAVAKATHGFDSATIAMSRPDDFEIGWFTKVLSGYTGTVYSHPAFVQWIPNQVTHLPRYDGTVLDSVYWGNGFAGNTNDNGVIANAAEPVSKWTQMVRNGTSAKSQCRTTSSRFWYASSVTNDPPYKFTGRHLNQMGDDLVALGGVFAKYESDMWDQDGASTAVEVTGNDADFDRLPDWWEEYANENYRMDPTQDLAWFTLVNYTDLNGNRITITAGEAYIRDLARGYYCGPDGAIVLDEEKYRQVADRDQDGMPDWWEDLQGIQQHSKLDSVRDEDNDGLSNYQEYLLSSGESPYGMGRGFPLLDPKNPLTSVGQKVPDYFLPGPTNYAAGVVSNKNYSLNEYLGEIATDHDNMEDWWENSYDRSYTSSAIYDPYDDKDGDGWSTFAECRAYIWYGGFSADLIDMWAESGLSWRAYPHPGIGIQVTYHGLQDVSSCGLVARTYTASSKRADAVFVAESAGSTVATNAIIGSYYEGGQTFHGFLHPGRIMPGLAIQYASSLSDRLYKWRRVLPGGSKGPVQTTSFAAYLAAKQIYEVEFIEANLNLRSLFIDETDAFGRTGVIRYAGTNITTKAAFGSVNYLTGEYELDMAKIEEAEPGVSHSNMIMKVNYTYQIGKEWPQTLWLSSANSGRVLEGKNTIEVFADLNGDGVYTVGEPYGMVRNVAVGWHKVPIVTVELTDSSVVVPRTAFSTSQTAAKDDSSKDSAAAEESMTTDVRIMRESINGVAKTRKVFRKTFTNDDRSYLTEADVLKDAIFDLDWNTLAIDAEDVCNGVSNVNTVVYRVEALSTGLDGVVSNRVVSTFSKSFLSSRPMAKGLEPVDEAPVYASAPTFRFRADEKATAFALEIAEAKSKKVVYQSGVKTLPGRDSLYVSSAICSYTPPVYVESTVQTNGEYVLRDGSNYLWRVKLFNAKFCDVATDAGFSDWCEFQMDVANANRYSEEPTGYGNLDVAVRYYGPARKFADYSITNIIVEAFENADFTGQPLAQARVSLGDKLSSIDDIETVNAHLTGVAPGKVYVRAFIDRADPNGVRNSTWDRYESWGYYKDINNGHRAINNPLSVEVGSTVAERLHPNAALVYIEDTDVNKNEVPDCLDDYSMMTNWVNSIDNPDVELSMTVDSDYDGLNDYEEENIYGTDPEVSDTDGDGMWDGWEVQHGTDPNAPDADAALGNDLMAYVETTVRVAVRGDEEYVVRPGATETDSLTNRLYRTFRMDNRLFVGAPTEYVLDQAEAVTVVTNAVLMHGAVYDFFGYDRTTARLSFCVGSNVVESANTAPFTAILKYYTDKYYLPQFGITTEPVSPQYIDSNANGIDDGWELYVGFARVAPSKTFPVSEEEKVKVAFENNFDPWDAFSVFNTVLSDDLRGVLVPFTNDEAIENGWVTADSNYWSFASASDYMAYAEKQLQIARVDGEIYVVRPDGVGEGRVSPTNVLYTTFTLENGQLVVGAKTDKTVAVNADSLTTTNVVLIHGAVYDFFGFDPTTARPSTGEGTNTVDGANTIAFTRAWKEVTNKGYLPEFGIVDEPLDYDKADASANTIDDGWELYVGLADVNPDKTFPVSDNEKMSHAFGLNRMGAMYDPNTILLRSAYNGKDISNYDAVEYRLFTYSVTNTIFSLNTETDTDNDGLTNFMEYRAKEELGLILDVDNASTGGVTPDYFRVGEGNVYGGEVGNGAEWIESSMREMMDVSAANRVGTRPMEETGWDYWSVARNSNNFSGDVNLKGVSAELALVIRYLNVVNPGELTNSTLVAVRNFIRTTYAGMTRGWPPEGEGDEPTIVKEDDGVGGNFEYIISVSTVVTTADMVRFFGGKTRMQRVIDENEIRKTRVPEPSFGLTLRYKGNETKEVLVRAYQMSSANPDRGQEISAEWTITALFNQGLYYTELPKPAYGSLKQGYVKFYACISGEEVDVDSAQVAAYGFAECNVGFAGGKIDITLGTPNVALPVINLGASNLVHSLAFVRTAINGQQLETPQGVLVKYYPNNVARQRLYPDDFVSPNFIGVDKLLADFNNEYNGRKITSVDYVVMDGKNRPFITGGVTNNILASFSVNYSEGRDMAKIQTISTALASSATLSFTVPVETINTKYWLKATKKGKSKIYGGQSGLVMPFASYDLVRIDLVAIMGADLVAGDYEFSVALGNDKFGRPAEDDDESWCTAVPQFIANDIVSTGAFKVTTKHPTASSADFLANQLVVAAYDQEDLSEPLKIYRGSVGTELLCSGLIPEKKYYLAAWYVKNPDDGRGEKGLAYRQPYDTWGYVYAMGCVSSMDTNANCFTAYALAAATNGTPVTIYLQDTDFNNNMMVDRLENMTASVCLANVAPAIDPYADFDEDSIPDAFDPDPVFAFGADEASDIDLEAISEESTGTTAAATVDEADRIARGDLMAYYDMPGKLVEIDSDTWYAVMDSAEYELLKKGSSVTNFTSLSTVYEYGKNRVGLGHHVDLRSGVVTFSTNVTLRLVHAQVYAQFGYDWPKHTKAFTAADKYLVVRYLEAIGVEGVDEDALILDSTNSLWNVFNNDRTGRDKADSDGDGIADGWELYTMFGKTNLKAFLEKSSFGKLADAKVSPWNVADGLRLTAPKWSEPPSERTALDGLLLVEEFDNGHYPTDPWAMDTDGDGVTDYYAYLYHLKGDDAGKDFDGDGLSNYAEYLITEVFKYAKCNPDVAKTNGGCVDYFKKIGSLYLGEIFTDHDKVGDTWEETYSTAANRYAYDPDRDDDEDGWSNYAEYRAGTDPTVNTALSIDGYTMPEYPVPVIEAKVVYNGKDVLTAPVVFKAWNTSRDPEMTSVPDAIWTISTAETNGSGVASRFFGRKPTSSSVYYLGGGFVQPGSVSLSFYDPTYIRWGSTNSTLLADAAWYRGVTDNGVGDLRDYAGNVVGTIDYATGKMSVDFDALKGNVYGNLQRLTVGNKPDGSVYDLIHLDESFVRADWEATTVGTAIAGTYRLTDPDAVSSAEGHKAIGHISEGKSAFMVFVDNDNSGDYTPGEPYGFVSDVDVGWVGAKFTVELSETSAITPRINLWDDSYDRARYVGENIEPAYSQPYYSSRIGYTSGSNLLASTAQNSSIRVRVARFAIDGYYTFDCGPTNRVVLDKYFSAEGRKYLTEADFLDNGEFDIDWSYAKSEIYDKLDSYYYHMTNVTYIVALGEGRTGFERSYQTNSTDAIQALTTFVTRRFEDVRSMPEARGLKSGNILYGGHPIFKWAMPNEELYAKRFGSSYTAFRILLFDADTDNLVWDSEVQRAPAQNANGEFVWEAPISPGDQLPGGEIFSRAGNWYWTVIMYNAKFIPSSNLADDYYDYAAPNSYFSTAVGQQQVTDDHNYHSVNVAVKYAGPEEVLGECDDLTSTEGIVRVQAFDNPDFAGDPAAQTFVTNKVKLIDTEDNTANVTLYGLAAGTYYIRAYIDSNGNFEKDDWESWGYATNMVSLAASKQPPTVGLYIEDADTDNDWLPDAWEYVKYGDLTSENAFVDPEGKIVLKTTTYQSIVNGTANISTTLSGSSLTFFENLGAARLLLGNLTTGNSTETTLAEIRKAVEKKVVENTVKVTSLVVDAKNKQVKLMVEADVSDTISGSLFSAVYDITSTVTVRVWNKKTIVEEWKTYTDYPVTITSALKSAITVSVSEGFDSGFYKVDVIQ